MTTTSTAPQITVAGIATGNMRHLILGEQTACGRDATVTRGARTGGLGERDEDGAQIKWGCRNCDREADRNPRRCGLR
jgi:hypothetical protein